MRGWTFGPAAGLPDPTSIERQKTAYAKGLEEQLRWEEVESDVAERHGTDVLAQQLKQQSEYLFAARSPRLTGLDSTCGFSSCQMGDQRKRQFALQARH